MEIERSAIEKFIQNNHITDTPTKIGKYWYHCDNEGNLFKADANVLTSTSSFLISFQAKCSGDVSVDFYSNGSGYTIGNDGATKHMKNASPGLGGFQDQQNFTTYTMENEYNTKGTPNNITIVTRDACDFRYDDNSIASRVEKALKESLQDMGLTVKDMTYSGFSDGGLQAILFANKMGDICDNNRLIFFDTTYFRELSEECYSYIADHNMEVVIYATQDRANTTLTHVEYGNADTSSYLAPFIRNKIPVTIIGGSGVSHNIRDWFELSSIANVNLYDRNLTLDELSHFNNGIYANTVSYRILYDESGKPYIAEISGDDFIYESSGSGYKYISKTDFNIYKERTNNLINLSQITKKDLKVETITSDKAEVLSMMNAIRSAVSKQESLSNLGSYDFGESTTKVPTCERDFVSRYYDKKLRILEKIANSTIDVISAAFEIDLNDKKLALAWENETNETNSATTKSDIVPRGGYVAPGGTETSPTSIYSNFQKYDSIIETENKSVQDLGDCKLIVHHEGEKVLGVEYYYDCGSAEKAKEMYTEISNKYANFENYKETIINGQYIKVTFDENKVGALSFKDACQKYSGGTHENM